MSKIRSSPTESAGYNHYYLKKGNDSNLWVSVPNKKPGDLLESIYDKLPMQIKNKFEPCKAFLKFINTYLVNKIPKTLFYYYQTLIDEYMGLSLESDDSSINILSPQSFYELDGHFHKSHTDDLLKLLFAENPNIDYIYLFPDLELLYSLFKKNESKIELRGFARDINYNQSTENLNPITFTKEYRENIYNILSNKYKIPVAKARKNINLKNKYTKNNYFPNYDNHFITVYYDSNFRPNTSKKERSKKSKKSKKSRKSKKSKK